MRAFMLFIVLLAAILASPAMAQSKKDLAAQNVALEQRLARLEQRMLTGDPAAERLMQRMSALETAQRTLTGEVERLRFERDNLKSEVEALEGDIRSMQDLSNRMRIHLEAVELVAKEQAQRPTIRSGPTSPISAIPSAPVYKEQDLVISDPNTGVMDTETLAGQASVIRSAPSNDVTQLGQVGKTKLAEGDYSGAQVALKQYLQFNADAPDVGEMNYWLGESYYVRGGYADAAASYIESMRRAPQGIKAPDAMIRLAGSLRELGQTAEACQTLGSFPSQYPNAPEQTKNKARTEAARTGC